MAKMELHVYSIASEEKLRGFSRHISSNVFLTNTIAPQQLSWLTRDWLLGLILIEAIILTYIPVWQAGFIWDDEPFITANPCIVGPFGLKEIWTTNAADICPLTLTTVWMEHALWRLTPLPYHLMNVLLHGACAVLLWLVLRQMRVSGAWVGAALWALHPVQVESVAWITEIKNTQSGLFFLLSVLFFVKGLKADEGSFHRGSTKNYVLTLLFAALAMASKSSTVILPVVLCLCAWWVENRWDWRQLARLTPIVFMSIATCVLSIWTQRMGSIENPQWVRTWPQRLVTAGDAVWFYMGKLGWPHPLITIYPLWETDAVQWASYLPLLAVIVILFILWFKCNTWSRPWILAFAYFLVALLPVLGLVSMSFFRYSLVSDHFQYLASMGPMALAGSALAWLLDAVIPKKWWLQSIPVAAVLLILGTWSWQRAWVYKNEETLWNDTLAKDPNCWAGYNNLGRALFLKGQVDEAIIQYQKALKINPNYFEAHVNFGAALFQKRLFSEATAQYQDVLKIDPNSDQAHEGIGIIFSEQNYMDKAIAEYQKALRINPYNADVHYNFGVALFLEGKLDDAIAQYKMTLEIDPNFIRARNGLGTLFFKQGHADEALAQYQAALTIDPNNAEVHYNFGLALYLEKKLDDAITQYKTALEIDPTYLQAYNNLGAVFFKKGQFDDAMAQYQKALQIAPRDAQAYNHLGSCFVQKGQLDNAIPQFEKALEIRPEYAEAHFNLGIALSKNGQLDKAINQFQQALRIDPTFVQADDSLGIILIQKGRLDEALKPFIEALRLDPHSSYAQDNLAKLHLMLKQRDHNKQDQGIYMHTIILKTYERHVTELENA